MINLISRPWNRGLTPLKLKMNSSTNICTTLNTFYIPNDTIANALLQTEFDYLVAMYFVPTLALLGTFGNISFLFMLIRLPYMRTNVNAYLANLAIVDSLYLLIVAPIHIYSVYESPIDLSFPFTGEYSCLAFFAVGYLSYYSSVGLITVISYERYYAICWPLRHRKIRGRTRTTALLTMSWIVAVVLSGFTLTRRADLVVTCYIWPDTDKYRNIPTRYNTCGPIGGRSFYVISMTILYIVYFFVAGVLNGYHYIKIIVVLTRRTAVPEKSLSRHASQIRNQVARALVILGLVYFTSETPIRIGDINEVLTEFGLAGFLTSYQIAMLNSIGFASLYLNSAVNSYIYVFSSSFYRQGFLEAFWISRRKNGNTPSMRSNISTKSGRSRRSCTHDSTPIVKNGRSGSHHHDHGHENGALSARNTLDDDAATSESTWL